MTTYQEALAAELTTLDHYIAALSARLEIVRAERDLLAKRIADEAGQ